MARPEYELKNTPVAEEQPAADGKRRWRLLDRRDPMRIFFMGSYMRRPMDVLDFYESLTKTIYAPLLGKYFFKPIINLYGAQYHSGRATPLRDVIPMIREAKSLAVSECACRVRLNKCDHSTRTCLKVNTGAEVELVKGQLKSERVAADEAIRIVEQAYKDGLMLSVEWCFEPNTYSICCCCDCCCVSRKLRFERGIVSAVMSSEYVPKFDMNACANCGRCGELCPGKAISVINGARIVDTGLCVGCGLCEFHCPADAVELIEAREPAVAKENNWTHYLIVYISSLFVLIPHYVIYLLVKRKPRERARAIEW